MFNIDINNTIDNLPEQARTTVLYSLVGSLNVRIVGAAQRIVTTCDKHGEDLHAEINEGFPCTAYESKAMSELGTQDDWFATIRVVNQLRNHLLVKLATTLNKEENEVLPLEGTLKFMTEGDIKLLPKEMIEELVKALDIEGLDVETIQTVDKMDKAGRRSALFTIRERVSAVMHQIPGHDADEQAFDHLPHEVGIRILDKMNDALNKARNDAVLAFVRRSSRANIGDIPLIQAAIKEVAAVIKEGYITNNNVDITTHCEPAPSTPAKKGNKRTVVTTHDDLTEAYAA